ncbi:MAG: GIY-YIG nuclease family protein [Pseudomonadota bacterium]
MLRCANGSYYVGSARASLEKRIGEHQSGLIPGYTSTRRPVELVHHEWFERIEDAISAERRLKGWSRAKKEALIAGNFEDLRALSKRGPKKASSFEPPPGGGSKDEAPVPVKVVIQRAGCSKRS